MFESFAAALTAKPVLVGLHLGFAIVGIDCTLWLWGELVARSEHQRRMVWVAAGGVLGYLVSWLIGGYYYVKFYGSLVKPGVIAGNAPWAHEIVMEVKEHIFLFLLPLALTIFFFAFFSRDALDGGRLRKPFRNLVMLTALLGLLIGAMGFIISAAARWAS